MKSSILVPAALIINLAGCSTQPSDSHLKAVIGSDDRMSVDTQKDTWAPVGRLNIKFPGSQGHCTGTLVGPSHVVTAAHCLYETKADGTVIKFQSATFYPEYAYDPGPASGKVIDHRVGTTKPRSNFADDWAIIKLDTDLGMTYGYYDLTGWSLANLNGSFKVDMVGYSNDAAQGDILTGHYDCSLDGEDAQIKKALSHSCDSSPGSSGAAMIYWDDTGETTVGVVAAINVAEFSDGSRNIASTTEKAYDALTDLW